MQIKNLKEQNKKDYIKERQAVKQSIKEVQKELVKAEVMVVFERLKDK